MRLCPFSFGCCENQSRRFVVADACFCLPSVSCCFAASFCEQSSGDDIVAPIVEDSTDGVGVALDDDDDDVE